MLRCGRSGIKVGIDRGQSLFETVGHGHCDQPTLETELVKQRIAPVAGQEFQILRRIGTVHAATRDAGRRRSGGRDRIAAVEIPVHVPLPSCLGCAPMPDAGCGWAGNPGPGCEPECRIRRPNMKAGRYDGRCGETHTASGGCRYRLSRRTDGSANRVRAVRADR